MSQVESVCARCAREKGLSCCQVPQGEKLATLTFSDIQRIEEATGLPMQRFTEREQLDPLARLAYETLRPIYRGVFVGGVRFGLKSRRGACALFKIGQGCVLPIDARPMACMLYPFDFDLMGTITLVDAPHCLALDLAQNGKQLLRLFGTSCAKLAKLRAQALSEGAAHAAQLRRQQKHAPPA